MKGNATIDSKSCAELDHCLTDLENMRATLRCVMIAADALDTDHDSENLPEITGLTLARALIFLEHSLDKSIAWLWDFADNAHIVDGSPEKTDNHPEFPLETGRKSTTEL